MRYSFDDFTLDLECRELRQAGALRALAPQVFDLLIYLIRHRDRVVSKDDLVNAIWKGRIVSEAAMTTRLNVLRTAIGDSGKEQRLLKTFPRKGVRFVGMVREDNGRPDGPAARIDGRGPTWHLLGASRPSIFVSRFVNQSDDPQLDVAGRGIAEDITTALLRRRETTVLASVADRVGDNADPRAVGHDHGARYAVTGSLRQEGDGTRISARLTEMTSGVHLWGRHFDLPSSTPARDDAVVAVTTSGISAAIRNAELRRARHKRADELGAWDAYQLGLWHMSKSEAVDNRLARSLFRRAVDLDPQFGPGYSAIAFTYTAASSAFSELSILESCEIADPLVRRAIALDETDSEARSRLALLALLRGDLEGAKHDADVALSIDETCPDAWGVKGASLSYAGRRTEGRAAIKRYFSLEPRDIARPIRLTQLASSFYMDGGYVEAVHAARQVVRRYPQHPFAYRWLAAALGQLGRTGEAQNALSTLQTISPSSFEMYIRQRPPQFCCGEYVPMLEGLKMAGWRE